MEIHPLVERPAANTAGESTMSNIDNTSSTSVRKGSTRKPHRTASEAVTSDLGNDATYFGLPASTVWDDEPLDDAVVLEGLPVFDAQKLDAYPRQDDVLGAIEAFIFSGATGIWGEYEPYLINHAKQLNAEHFGGKLVIPEIIIGNCQSPRLTFGQYRARGDHGLLGEITFNSRLFTNQVPGVHLNEKTKPGFLRFIKDILLHELTHSFCHLVRKDPETSYRGHGPVFTEECNRIGKALKREPVKHTKSKKTIELHLHKCDQWPHCVRPGDYYLGAFVEAPKPAKDEPNNLDELLEADGPGAGSILAKLYSYAQGLKGSPADYKRLALALVYQLRKATAKPTSLPQFPEIQEDVTEPAMPEVAA